MVGILQIRWRLVLNYKKTNGNIRLAEATT